ncbi:MAG: hypothetical protein ACO1QS_12625 [Verrucomicrobiota bacterium]
MDDQTKPKQNWWVDVALFLAAPVVAVLIGLIGGVLREFGALLLLAPLPCGLVLRSRMARRVARKETVIALLTLFFGAFFAAAIAAATMFGCSGWWMV